MSPSSSHHFRLLKLSSRIQWVQQRWQFTGSSRQLLQISRNGRQTSFRQCWQLQRYYKCLLKRWISLLHFGLSSWHPLLWWRRCSSPHSLLAQRWLSTQSNVLWTETKNRKWLNYHSNCRNWLISHVQNHVRRRIVFRLLSLCCQCRISQKHYYKWALDGWSSKWNQLRSIYR